MKVEWYLGQTKPKEKEELRQMLIANRKSLEHLRAVLEKRVIKRTSPDDYHCPSWAYLQADQNGWNRAMEHVISLIKDLEE